MHGPRLRVAQDACHPDSGALRTCELSGEIVLEPNAHHDLPDLPDDRASEMGLLITRIARAIESLPHLARAHVSRWGDGGAHLHIFFFARPAGFAQLRGTCLAIWDDLLPAIPAHQRDRDAGDIAQALADSYGGRTHPGP